MGPVLKRGIEHLRRGHYRWWIHYLLLSSGSPTSSGSHARLLEDETPAPTGGPYSELEAVDKPERHTHAQNNSNLLASFPTEKAEKVPPHVLNGVTHMILEGVMNIYTPVLDYLGGYPKLPRYEDNASRACPICLDEIERHPNCRVGALKCGHMFHPKCLEQMVVTGNQSNCPLCQTPIDRLLSFQFDGTTGQIKIGSPVNCTLPASETQWGDYEYMGFLLMYVSEQRPDGSMAYKLRDLTLHSVDHDDGTYYGKRGHPCVV